MTEFAACAVRLAGAANSNFDLTRWLTVVDDGLGLEHLLVFAVPRTESSAVIDLHWLAQEGVMRGGESGSLQGLLQSIKSGQNLRGDSFAISEDILGIGVVHGPTVVRRFQSLSRLQAAADMDRDQILVPQRPTMVPVG